MNAWSLLAAVAVLSLSSCGLSSEKKAVIARAGSIHEFPVPRATLMATLGLGSQPGKRHDVTIRGRRVSSSETWEHPAGLTIAAHDVRLTQREMGDVVLGRTTDDRSADDMVPIREEIDDFLLGENAGELGLPDEPASGASFDRFEVKDGKKVIFRSGEGDRGSQR
ncbi:MAG: hypothetical protein EOP83_11305 [Verrucomicrobiaceae bacterium]|nr:MAG: hypothetical protein EOP83_11305 [Verrucomicrobiaceae bacterium]